MHCFNHADRPAVGICKSCNKGLCKECLTELPNGIACKASCEERVALLVRLVDNNKRMIATSNFHVSLGTWFLMTFALLPLAFGGLLLFSGDDSVDGWIFFVSGLVFLGMALIRLRAKSKFPDAD